VPETARDYIILHELMHLRVMSHSRRLRECVVNDNHSSLREK
jgi:predicted metal-dependent hydrolase